MQYYMAVNRDLRFPTFVLKKKNAPKSQPSSFFYYCTVLLILIEDIRTCSPSVPYRCQCHLSFLQAETLVHDPRKHTTGIPGILVIPAGKAVNSVLLAGEGFKLAYPISTSDVPV